MSDSITKEHSETVCATQQVVLALPSDRRKQLRTWMRANGLTLAILGEWLGITASGVFHCLGRERMPVRHHTILVYHGIPANLLPPAVDSPLGCKIKADRK